MHKTRIIAVFVLVLSVVAQLAAWQTERDHPLTNKDIISLVTNRLTEGVILKHIASHKTDFDVSTNGLIHLKTAGVPPKVIEAMQAATRGSEASATIAAAPPPAAPSAPSQPAPAPVAPVAAAEPSGQPAVFLLQGSSKLPVPAEATKLAHTKTKAKSLLDLAKDKAILDAINEAINAAANMVQGMAKGKAGQAAANIGVDVGKSLVPTSSPSSQDSKQTYVWALQGPGSATSTPGNSPSFEVSYAGITGVNSDAFEPVILKLAVAQAADRLVGATQASTNTAQSAQADWPIYSSFVDERVPATIKQLGSGRVQIAPKSALPAGQYAVALRPKDKSHKFTGQDVAGNQGEGLLFNYAWSFAVN